MYCSLKYLCLLQIFSKASIWFFCFFRSPTPTQPEQHSTQIHWWIDKACPKVFEWRCECVSVCLMFRTCYSTYIRFTVLTPTHRERSADAADQHHGVVLCLDPDSKQHMLESSERHSPLLLCLYAVCVCVLLDSCTVFFAQAIAGKRKENGPSRWKQQPCLEVDHRIHVFPQLVRQLVCVLCSSRLPWFNPIPLNPWKRPVSRMNLVKVLDPCYILVSLVTAQFMQHLPMVLIKGLTPGSCKVWFW